MGNVVMCNDEGGVKWQGFCPSFVRLLYGVLKMEGIADEVYEMTCGTRFR